MPLCQGIDASTATKKAAGYLEDGGKLSASQGRYFMLFSDLSIRRCIYRLDFVTPAFYASEEK